MPKVINYGEMFVVPCSKSKGSYFAYIPLVWEGDKTEIHSKYFGKDDYHYPKGEANRYVKEFLENYYGKSRADFILNIPQFVKRMKFGCGVSYRRQNRMSRGVTYPIFDLSFTEHVDQLYDDSKKRFKSVRKRISRAYNPLNCVEVEHKITLMAAEIRAKVAVSELHPSALNFEYDLYYNKE